MKYSVQEKEYRFNEEEHCHEILVDGVWSPAIGISSVVKDLVNYGAAAYYGSRRALMELGYDPKDAPKALQSFIDNAKELIGLNAEQLEKRLKSAYTAHAKYAKKRADKGTDSHLELNVWANKCLSENQGYFLMVGDSITPKVKKFLDMIIPLVGKKARIIATEKHAYNKDLFIAGITDLILSDEQGKIVIADYKDRNAIYDKDLLQMFGYTFLYPLPVDYVVGIPLEGDKPWPWYDMEKGRKAFLGQLESYKFRNNLISPYK